MVYIYIYGLPFTINKNPKFVSIISYFWGYHHLLGKYPNKNITKNEGEYRNFLVGLPTGGISQVGGFQMKNGGQPPVIISIFRVDFPKNPNHPAFLGHPRDRNPQFVVVYRKRVKKWSKMDHPKCWMNPNEKKYKWWMLSFFSGPFTLHYTI